MSVEFRIMAIKERREKYILNMLKSLNLPESIVTYDDDDKDIQAMRNSRRTWLKPSKASHVCVLQDDVELCNNFVEIVNICSENFPDAVFSFFQTRLDKDDINPETPYIKVRGCGMYGPCILMPSHLISCVFEWGDAVYGKNFLHDDTIFGFFCHQHKIPVMTTAPAIIQHLAPMESKLGHNRKSSVSRIYQKDVNPEIFKTNKFAMSRQYIGNSMIVPEGGFKTGKLMRLDEIWKEM